MGKFATCMIVLVLSFVLTYDTAVGSQTEDYRIGAGDVLAISVWKDEALTRQVVVLPDGMISFPLIGRVRADGKGLEELRQVIGERLARFVPDPILSIEVVKVNSLMVYVIGKVNRPGRFELMSNINVIQALALAGGLNPYAKSGKIKIFRKAGAQTETLLFDYDDVAKGKSQEQNVLLKRGDVIVVP